MQEIVLFLKACVKKVELSGKMLNKSPFLGWKAGLKNGVRILTKYAEAIMIHHRIAL